MSTVSNGSAATTPVAEALLKQLDGLIPPFVRAEGAPGRLSAAEKREKADLEARRAALLEILRQAAADGAAAPRLTAELEAAAQQAAGWKRQFDGATEMLELLVGPCGLAQVLSQLARHLGANITNLDLVDSDDPTVSYRAGIAEVDHHLGPDSSDPGRLELEADGIKIEVDLTEQGIQSSHLRAIAAAFGRKARRELRERREADRRASTS